jgi:hypothetical protein
MGTGDVMAAWASQDIYSYPVNTVHAVPSTSLYLPSPPQVVMTENHSSISVTPGPPSS